MYLIFNPSKDDINYKDDSDEILIFFFKSQIDISINCKNLLPKYFNYFNSNLSLQFYDNMKIRYGK